MNRVHFTSLKQDWTTPEDFYKGLDAEFHFDFDPCPVNPTFHGLAVEWGNCNFVNPPYKYLKSWVII